MQARNPFLTALGLAVAVATALSVAKSGEPKGASGPPPRPPISRKAKSKTSARPAANATNEVRTLTHAGKQRTAILHVPQSPRAAAPRPLMIALHGLMTTGAMTQALTAFDRVADQHDFIVAYPDGVGMVWRFWEGTSRKPPLRDYEEVDDPGFLLHLIDDLVAEKLVDPTRVYLTGLSNGGFMTNRMAWEHADRFAAIAPVAGTIPNLMLHMKPPRAIPTLVIHGTDDQIVEFAGSKKFGSIGQFIGARELAEWWAARNRCGPAESKLLADKVDDGTSIKQVRFPAADRDGAEVVLLEITGGGHTWPGKIIVPKQLLGNTCQDLSASEAIWEFCSKHRLPAKAKAK